MNNSHNNIGLFPQMPVCDEVLHSEINSDFTLPDYKSEIKKLISTKVRILPPKQYLGNSKANLEGEVVYKILYVGADNSLYSATLSDKYGFDADLHFDSHSVNTDEIALHSLCECENSSTRVLGPRKINVRSKLLCRAFALSPSIYKPELMGAHDPSCIENLVMEAPSLVTHTCESEPISLSDVFAIDPQIDNIRIIDTCGTVLVGECQASVDKIEVRGEAWVKILYCNDAESEEELIMTRKLPFSTTMLCEGVDPSYECCAYGTVNEESATVDDASVKTELILSIHAQAQANKAVPYISDSFSTERAVNNEFDEVVLTKGVKAFNGNLSQNEVFMLSDTRLDPDFKIIDTDATAKIRSSSYENGKIVLLGECNYQLVCYSKGEYSLCELSAPIKYELDQRNLAIEGETKLINGIATVVSTRARCDGERIYIDSELNFCISIKNQYKISLLKETEFGERLTHPKGCMVLCYPKEKSSLWDIAKKYGVTTHKLREKNAISESNDISKKKFIVI